MRPGGGPRTARARTPRQRAGDRAEDAALAHIVATGCRLLARNARYPDGELDLIVRDGELLAFIEVRLRSRVSFGGAAASVDRFKQKRIMRAAQRWLAEHFGERWPACRFDVVTVDGDGTIEWIRGAFTA
jgi:putative endonuclease